VIASDLPTFHEVAGDVPEYLDPLDALSWLQAIRDYAQVDHPRRAAQLQRLQGFASPTWQRHFELVDALLERLR
jgi:hypothetical protein